MPQDIPGISGFRQAAGIVLAIGLSLPAGDIWAAGEYLAIRADGEIGSVVHPSGAVLSVTLEMASGDYTDIPADWWILAETSGAWYHYTWASGFIPGIAATCQGGLQSFSSYEVAQVSDLPPGTYTFYFGVDLNVNGLIDMDMLVYQSVTVAVIAGAASALIQPADLAYRGAFRLPEYPADPGYGWEWGGNALTYYPEGDSAGGADGYPGSLYGAGNDQRMVVGEIGIPAPVISSARSLAALNTAPQLRAFHDIRAGIAALEQLYNNRMILYCGLAYLPAQGAQSGGRLYACFGDHFHDPGTPQYVPSHMWTDLALGDNHGAWWIDNQSLYSVNDYLFEIPST